MWSQLSERCFCILLLDETAPNYLIMVQRTLFSAMESVITMMREVELEEKAVDRVTEEAARGGQDIMVKVEELKLMLAHAKDANDMVVYCLIIKF